MPTLSVAHQLPYPATSQALSYSYRTEEIQLPPSILQLLKRTF